MPLPDTDGVRQTGALQFHALVTAEGLCRSCILAITEFDIEHTVRIRDRSPDGYPEMQKHLSALMAEHGYTQGWKRHCPPRRPHVGRLLTKLGARDRAQFVIVA